MPTENFSEQLWKGLGDAVRDIREKGVEEAWYGRALTEGQEYPQWGGAQEIAPSPGSSTHVIDSEPEHGKEKSQDVDLDR
jgi:hypothetical protein